MAREARRASDALVEAAAAIRVLKGEYGLVAYRFSEASDGKWPSPDMAAEFSKIRSKFTAQVGASLEELSAIQSALVQLLLKYEPKTQGVLEKNDLHPAEYGRPPLERPNNFSYLSGKDDHIMWLTFRKIDPEHSAADIAARNELPVSIFLAKGDDGTAEAVKKAVRGVLGELGFEMVADADPHRGSWRQSFRAKANDELAQQAILDRLIKLEHIVQTQLLNSQEGQANQQSATGAGAIINSLKNEPAAVVLMGSVLIVKTPGIDGYPVIAAKDLTAVELKALERQPDLLLDPLGILSRLPAISEKIEEEERAQAGNAQRRGRRATHAK